MACSNEALHGGQPLQAPHLFVAVHYIMPARMYAG